MDARCLLYISARFILSAHALEASSFHIAFVYVEYWTRMASRLLVMSQIMLWRPPHQKWEQTKWTFEATKHVSDSIGISDGSAFFSSFSLLRQTTAPQAPVCQTSDLSWWQHPKLRQGWTHLQDWPSGNLDSGEICGPQREEILIHPYHTVRLPSWQWGVFLLPEHHHHPVHKFGEKPEPPLAKKKTKTKSVLPATAEKKKNQLVDDGELHCHDWIHPPLPHHLVGRSHCQTWGHHLLCWENYQSRIWTPKVCRWNCHQRLPPWTHTLWDNPFKQSIRFKTSSHKNNFASAAWRS